MTITHISSSDKINDVVDKVNEVIDATNTIQGPFVSGVVQQSVDAAAEVIDQGVEDINDIKDDTISESNAIKAQTEVVRNQAEAARDAAFVNADVYADTAAGLAATTVGDQFQVVDGDEIIRYLHDTGPVATEVARYPSSSKVDAIEQSLLYPFQSIGITGDLPSGSNASRGTYTFAEPIEKNRQRRSLPL